MASLPHTQKVTYEEWLRMPEVKTKEEVVDGEIIIMPFPTWNHSEIAENLRDVILQQVDRRNIKVKAALFGLVIRKEPLTVRAPDLAIFQSSTIIELDGYIHSAPALAAEVVSPSNTRLKMQRKLADYASLGIPEVLLIFPDERTIEVLYLEEGVYQRQALLTDGILCPRLFPQVEIPIAAIWPS